MSAADEALREHMYDGIQEYDNPCPFWWSALFWLSILFSIVYVAYYHVGVEGRSLQDEYSRSVAENVRLQFKEIGELAADEPTILHYMNEPEWIQFGKVVYRTHCTSCHGQEGEGRVGPNLTDDYYKNVKKLVDILTVINVGAKQGAMPAWRQRLHPNEVVLVSAYVATLRGSKPTLAARDPEGDKIDPWPAAPEAPPVKTPPASAKE